MREKGGREVGRGEKFREIEREKEKEIYRENLGEIERMRVWKQSLGV